ncbi:MAG: recombination mediator RecR [Acidobacteriaceae bacterium]|nr:recombination mediator RecR [Acidobacteriaceae bacterium]
MATRFAAPMAQLIDELRKLPGVGTKTAQRYAFHILRSSNEDAESLANGIRALKQALRLCSVCNNITDVDPCAYCTASTRNGREICVVEEPTNIASIEKTRTYNGMYHVLHGTISPVNGVGPEQLRLENLWTRLAEVDEIILATSPTTEGEATARYLADELRKLHANLRVTRIATGVPAGSDIEYADEVTMTRALENRRVV